MTNKEKILKIIYQADCGITIKNIYDTYNGKIDKTTVYRNIEKLLSEKKIIEDFNENGEKIYSLSIHHHHHFICNDCGKKINVGCFFQSELERIRLEYNITIMNHSFLLNGLCNKCK